MATPFWPPLVKMGKIRLSRSPCFNLASFAKIFGLVVRKGKVFGKVCRLHGLCRPGGW
jgi:hypothetical protein